MSARELLRWQWSDYAAKHRTRGNLLIHIVAVPLFQIGALVAVYGVLRLAPIALGAGAAGLVVSLALQGRGHRLEPEAPAPFSSAGQFAARVILEQWITFPRFVLSGGWYRNLTMGSR